MKTTPSTISKTLSLFLTFFLFVVAIFLLTPKEAIAAYPPYTATSTPAIVGPYDTATSGSGNWGYLYGGEREFLTVGHQYRIRQNGTITRIRVYITATNLTGMSGLYLKIWRKNASSTYDLVGTSENLITKIATSTFNTIDLSSPITGVQEGDFYGYRLENSTSSQYLFYSKAATGASSYYQTDTSTSTTPSSTGYNWAGQSNIAAIVPIELYMQAPQFVFIGDSIMAGHPTHYTFIESTDTTNITSTIEYQFSQLTSYTYQNVGYGSQTTTAIASRFTSDVVNLYPRVAVIEGGVNNISGGNESAFLADWTSMLAAAQASNAIQNVIVLKILPWTNGTNAQLQERDIWNNDLATLAAGYSKAIVVDTSSYVGQFRAGGDAGNLWDIQPAYNLGGVHFNQAGHTQIAQAIADAIDNLPSPPSNLQTNSATNPSDVASTTPALSAEYDNANVSDPAAYYEVQVIASGGSWSSPLWDSGQTATNVAEGDRQTATYGGTPLTLSGATYYQRWRFWDSVSGHVGPYSDGSDYWVMQNNAPIAPSNIKTNSATNPSDVASTTPILSAEYDDPNAGDTALYYQVQVIKSDGSWASPLWDSGKTATNISEGSRQDVEYGGSSLPLTGATYYQRWRFWDDEGNEGSWSAGTDYWVMQHVIQNLISWQYVKKITISSSSVSGALSNFPVLINLSSDADLEAHAQANGNDILFTSSTISWNTGTENDKLPHEIESYSSSTGALVAWVNVPSVSSSTNTDIYMYYGNSSVINEQSATSTWDSNFAMVQHLNQSGLNGTSGEVHDSTANNSGAGSGGVTGGDTGKIGQAINFNGSQYIGLQATTMFSAGQSFTIEAWAKLTNLTTSQQGMILGNISNNNDFFWLCAYSTSTGCSLVRYRNSAGTSYDWPGITSSWEDTNWHYYALTADGTKATLYIDGNNKTSKSAVTSLQINGIGKAYSDKDFIGYIDEVRVSNMARSAAYISTSYNNQNSPSTFYTLGSESTRPAAPTMGTSTPLSSTAIRWNFTDNADDETGFRVYTNADVLATSSATANLTYLDETGLSENTQYTRYIKAYNSYGESASSSATSTYTLVDTPTGFNFMRHPRSLEIYVDGFPNSSSGSSGYLFWRTDNSSYNSGWIKTNQWHGANTVEGQAYTYGVKYRNGDGVETATTTLAGVWFISEVGGGGTPTIPPQTTTTVSTTTLATTTQNTTSATTTSATSTIATLKPPSTPSSQTNQAKQAQIQQIKAQIIVIQQKLIILISQLIQLLQEQLRLQLQTQH